MKRKSSAFYGVYLRESNILVRTCIRGQAKKTRVKTNDRGGIAYRAKKKLLRFYKLTIKKKKKPYNICPVALFGPIIYYLTLLRTKPTYPSNTRETVTVTLLCASSRRNARTVSNNATHIVCTYCAAVYYAVYRRRVY